LGNDPGSCRSWARKNHTKSKAKSLRRKLGGEKSNRGGKKRKSIGARNEKKSEADSP